MTAAYRFLEFLTAQIRNPNTRRTYVRAGGEFLTWLETQGVASIAAASSLHVAAYVEQLTRSQQSAPTVKQQLAAIRRLFDWLAAGGVLPFNPASAVRSPSHSAKTGATPMLDPQEARQLIDAIDITTPIGLRDRALIGLMVYSFARIGAATGMRVEDVFIRLPRDWVGFLSRTSRTDPISRIWYHTHADMDPVLSFRISPLRHRCPDGRLAVFARVRSSRDEHRGGNDEAGEK